MALDHCEEPLLDLNAVLKLTLPALERNETTASLSNDELLDVLKVKPAHRLAFLVKELSRLDATPYVKDQLFDALDLYVRVKPTSTTTDSRSVSPCSCSLICCASSTPCPS